MQPSFGDHVWVNGVRLDLVGIQAYSKYQDKKDQRVEQSQMSEKPRR